MSTRKMEKGSLSGREWKPARWKGFMDESVSDGLFVLAGALAPETAWPEFANSWNEMLPYAGVNDKGQPEFHMVELAQRDNGYVKTRAFFNIITEHVPVLASVVLHMDKIEAAAARISAPNLTLNWTTLKNPFVITFSSLLDAIMSRRGDIDFRTGASALGANFNFTFDKRSDSGIVTNGWETFLSTRPNMMRKAYGERPVFEDSHKCPSLQAADLWAWWVRKWHVEGTFDDLANGGFEGWIPKRGPYMLNLEVDEDLLADIYWKTVNEIVGHGVPVTDSRYPDRGWTKPNTN
ncbi:DUF3800 domain-containing protein [Sphingobium nicotianae]|uniref:DUF3800 domain-containing protein n=1 Tax=Sphingobium nicotianae TaxID=2782607 RepID=A0A9X1DCN1_9SPHN|nr:DUF3800 domain-containing protein [Sphingobium nicotianae]MBT2187459.1 DUF3800 domain-containing protein [Sphingobium nicotianae]